MDWQAALQRQSAIANRMTEDVLQLLRAAELTSAQARQAYELVVMGADGFDIFVELMKEQDADAELFKMADEIGDTWAKLLVATGARVG